MNYKNIISKNIEYLNSREFFIRHNNLDKINDFVDSYNIVVLQWQRRVGKSYTIFSFLKQYWISYDKVFYFNKELDFNDDISDKSDLNNLFDIYLTENKEPEYIIIDEIQDIVGWEKFIREKFSYKKYKIIITWSNSSLLSSELATFLTWRYVSIYINSFSYKEFLEFKKLKSDDKSFDEYINFWWLPEVVFTNNIEFKKTYISNLVDSILLKDIVSRFSIKNVKLLEKILNFMSDNVWSNVSLSNIFNYLKQLLKKEISLNTISNYVKYLELPYLINEVKRYDIKWKRILDYVSKYFFTDVWVMNNHWFVFSEDIWKILENIVYNHLINNWYKIYVWNLWNVEIDFIWDRDWQKIYIQVCYLLVSKETVNREFGNLLNIKDNFPKYVVSMDNVFGWTYEWVVHMNIKDFLLMDI
jgi:predicted AAA+ superfamily ATPase